MKKLIFSTVLFKTPLKDIERLLESIDSLSLGFKKKNINLKIEKFLIWDNSLYRSNKYQNLNLSDLSFDVIISKSERNLGYGLGHNSNLLNQDINQNTWFIALNPDIYFQGEKMIPFFEYITSHSNIVCSAPLIFLQNGDIQYSAKKNPTFFSLIIGRFSFFQQIPFLRKYLDLNQNKNIDYKKQIIHSQFLSGCFLVIPSLVFSQIQGFSPKYFLHFEDADIVRRCNLQGLCIHCPLGSIIHIRGRGSHKSISQQLHLAFSYLRYSLTWGFKLF